MNRSFLGGLIGAAVLLFVFIVSEAVQLYRVILFLTALYSV
jgi:hypothetical protein